MRQQIVALVTFLGSLAVAGTGILFTMMLFMLPHTNENGRKIDAAFREVASFVDNSFQETGQWPSNKAWHEFRLAATSPGNRWVEKVEFAPYPEIEGHNELASSFKSRPSPGSYTLSLWRGEWTEYYASWEGKSTIPSAIRNWLDLGVPALACLTCGLFGFRWSNRLRRKANGWPIK